MVDLKIIQRVIEVAVPAIMSTGKGLEVMIRNIECIVEATAPPLFVSLLTNAKDLFRHQRRHELNLLLSSSCGRPSTFVFYREL